MIYIFFSVFGLLVGSFLNVLILRLPKEDDVVFKSSHCPKCLTKIKWYMNIPVISYVFLRGKCYFCKAKISLQYPIVEIITGYFSLYFAPKLITIDGLYNYSFYFSVFCVFLVHFIIDLRHKILPDSLNIYLFLLFICYSFFNFPLIHSVSGFLIGLLFPLSVAYAFYKLKGVEGLGGGDIKLFGVLGVFLGPIGVLQNLFLSCILGTIVGLILIALGKAQKNTGIPFGPSIISVATFQIFLPEYFAFFASLIGFNF
ncbi:MAG: prepilin peptidase [Halobacteriovoraceae bacterium]|nr:prepilin peptidase [Halobacteriovoraceae bacterium]|tara:strand:- start:1369 stop:2139 length:771 start_codon:yes stop_codon:yes gene_type:complete